jgi:hypothetical protein
MATRLAKLPRPLLLHLTISLAAPPRARSARARGTRRRATRTACGGPGARAQRGTRTVGDTCSCRRPPRRRTPSVAPPNTAATAAGKPERRRDSGSAGAASSFRSSSDGVLLNFYMPRSLTRSFTVGEGPVVWSSCSTASYYPHIESQSFFLKTTKQAQWKPYSPNY